MAAVARIAPTRERSSGSAAARRPRRTAVGVRRGLLGDDQLEPVVHVVGARPLDDEAPVPAPDEPEHGGRGDELPRPRAVELERDRADARVGGRHLDHGGRRVRERAARRVGHGEADRVRAGPEGSDLDPDARFLEGALVAEPGGRRGRGRRGRRRRDAEGAGQQRARRPRAPPRVRTLRRNRGTATAAPSPSPRSAASSAGAIRAWCQAPSASITRKTPSLAASHRPYAVPSSSPHAVEVEPREDEAAHREAADRQHSQPGERRDREREPLGLEGRRLTRPRCQKTVAKPIRPPTHDAMARRWSASRPRISHRPSVAAAPWLTSPPVITRAAASPVRSHRPPTPARPTTARPRRSPARRSHTRPGGAVRSAASVSRQRAGAGELARLEHEIQRPADRHGRASQDLHARRSPRRSDAEQRAGDEGAEKERAAHRDHPASERPPPRSAPDRGRGWPARRPGNADREHVGAVGHVTVVGGQDAPGDRVGAGRQRRERHAIAPWIGGLDPGVSPVDPLAAGVQHLERAGARLDALAEPDHRLARRLVEPRVRRRVHRSRNGVGLRGPGRRNDSQEQPGRNRPPPS